MPPDAVLSLAVQGAESGPAWELGKALVLDFLSLHGGLFADAQRVLEAIPESTLSDGSVLEILSEDQEGTAKVLFFMRIGDSIIALGPGKNRPLP